MTRREIIYTTVRDLVESLLNDGRKEDEELPRGAIEEAVQAREVTVADLCLIFNTHLWSALGPTEFAAVARGAELEQHRFQFEGSVSSLADHLVGQHSVAEPVVSKYAGGITQGHWVALDSLHKAVHEREAQEGSPQG